MQLIVSCIKNIKREFLTIKFILPLHHQVGWGCCQFDWMKGFSDNEVINTLGHPYYLMKTNQRRIFFAQPLSKNNEMNIHVSHWLENKKTLLESCCLFIVEYNSLSWINSRFLAS